MQELQNIFAKVRQKYSLPKQSTKKISEEFKRLQKIFDLGRTGTKEQIWKPHTRKVERGIIVYDPLVQQPVISGKIKPTKGSYIKFQVEKKKEEIDPVSLLIRKQQFDRLRKQLKKQPKPCPEGKVRNPRTGRCIKVKIDKKKD
ncbi:MAG TPA: hypothetical protein V6C58_17725 [Allocoleopsis sp.]